MIRFDPSGNSWISDQWNAFIVDMKSVHASWETAMSYWTMGFTDPFFTSAKVSMSSKEYWYAQAEVIFYAATMGKGAAGKQLIKQESKQVASSVVRIAKPIARLDTKIAANSLSSQLGGTVVEARGEGWKIINIANPLSKNQPIMIRVMNAGSGGRERDYFRVTVGTKGTLNLEGKLSSDLASTHIDLTDNYLEQIQNMINNYVKTGGK
ncbi:hypothetical protein CD191_06900 [Paenibacillus odorifer]|uniref:Uncharacterized protein n=1 Tax=Paenibacillus odorifer TaxID=189426 RepID=A0AAD0KJ39_9BACL|nr:hypothetical protein CD191_06900 [Paenibacillus odorifer]